MTHPLPELLDVVALRVAVGRWPVGTTGTVVDEADDWSMVEISDDDGRTLELVDAPKRALTVVTRPSLAP